MAKYTRTRRATMVLPLLLILNCITAVPLPSPTDLSTLDDAQIEAMIRNAIGSDTWSEAKRSAGLYSGWQNQMKNQDALAGLMKRSAGMYSGYTDQMNNQDFFKNLGMMKRTMHMDGNDMDPSYYSPVLKRSAGLYSGWTNQMNNDQALGQLFKRSAGLYSGWTNQMNNDQALSGLFKRSAGLYSGWTNQMANNNALGQLFKRGWLEPWKEVKRGMGFAALPTSPDGTLTAEQKQNALRDFYNSNMGMKKRAGAPPNFPYTYIQSQPISKHGAYITMPWSVFKRSEETNNNNESNNNNHQQSNSKSTDGDKNGANTKGQQTLQAPPAGL